MASSTFLTQNAQKTDEDVKKQELNQTNKVAPQKHSVKFKLLTLSDNHKKLINATQKVQQRRKEKNKKTEKEKVTFKLRSIASEFNLPLT